MVKTIHETVSDEDHEIIVKAKGKLTWRTWLIATARSQLEDER